MISRNDKKVCLIFSGGLDSTTLLYDLKHPESEVHCLSFDYGQRHKRELEAALKISTQLNVSHDLIDLTQLTSLVFGGSSQTSNWIDVPEGHYADASMRKTVVPNRNMIMLSLAAAFCISHNIRDLYYAAHAGDHTIYPDCRPEFVESCARTLQLAGYEDEYVRLYAPYIRFSKAEIVKLGAHLKVPFEQTWSCYKGGKLHCGKCGTCVERQEAFALANIPDPTSYE